MPLVLSVVLPVVDALSWDVAPGAHQVVVNLEKHDRDLDKVDKFNAAAVVAFARTRSIEDLRLLHGCVCDADMLRSGEWLLALRRRMAQRGDWKLRHVYTAARV